MQCQYTKSDGKQCGGYAVSGSQFCFSHDPASRKEHKRAARKGGLASKDDNKAILDGIDLSTSEGLENLLKDTIARIRRVNPDGSIDSKTAYTIGFLTTKLHEIHTKSYGEERLAHIEQREAELEQKERAEKERGELYEQELMENPIKRISEDIENHQQLIRCYEKTLSMLKAGVPPKVALSRL